ncbi:MAG: 30S ribosomal protein S20 [Bacteroidetes bacterium]|jgi:small subunit ribosomal protein S20|nr:MAG: 30S ribosomal protein S20 [Bacteroidota bacterium]
MAHHKSALKRIRQNAKRRLRNRFQKVGMRLAVKRLRGTHNKTEAAELLPAVISTIDKVAKKNIIHKNNASNLKSKLTRYVNKLA